MRNDDLMWFEYPEKNYGYVLTHNKVDEWVFHTYDLSDTDNRYWGHYFCGNLPGALIYFKERVNELMQAMIENAQEANRQALKELSNG